MIKPPRLRPGDTVGVIAPGGAVYDRAAHDRGVSALEALGYHHYVGKPDVDDAQLYENGVDRIYDTYGNEKEYRKVDTRVEKLADKLVKTETKGRWFEMASKESKTQSRYLTLQERKVLSLYAEATRMRRLHLNSA
jgi:deoxyhypusine synthase